MTENSGTWAFTLFSGNVVAVRGFTETRVSGYNLRMGVILAEIGDCWQGNYAWVEFRGNVYLQFGHNPGLALAKIESQIGLSGHVDVLNFELQGIYGEDLVFPDFSDPFA